MESYLQLENKTLTQQIFAPVNIAIIVSLGLHGFVLGLALPYFQWPDPSPPTPTEEDSTVGVIELTPAELSRLPETDPQRALVFPTQPNFPNPKLPASALPNPNFPPPAELPTMPALPPIPQLPSYPNLLPLTRINRLPITTPPIPSLPRAPRAPLSPPRSIQPNLPSPPTSAGSDRPNFPPIPPGQGTDFIDNAPQNSNVGALPTPTPAPALERDGVADTPQQVRTNSLESIAQEGMAIKKRVSVAAAYPQQACSSRAEGGAVNSGRTATEE